MDRNPEIHLKETRVRKGLERMGNRQQTDRQEQTNDDARSSHMQQNLQQKHAFTQAGIQTYFHTVQNSQPVFDLYFHEQPI